MAELTGLRCTHCGHALPLDHKEVCPLCGSVLQVHEMTLAATLGFRASLAWNTTGEFYEKRPLLLSVVVIITLGPPFLGLFIDGLRGVLVGLGFGVVAFLLGLMALTKVRHTREGNAP